MLRKIFFNIMVLITVPAAIAIAQSGGGFDLTWSTVDGGGLMNSTGGTFSLSGTIGQPDAQVPPVMTGGSFEVTGGGFGGTFTSTLCRMKSFEIGP